MENRVYCLYRVSTNRQVDYNDQQEADIPMQRKACHLFAEKMGWTIVHEEQEDGVSGHKVRAENRDKLQIIKEHAQQGKFDILLVFMFDRIGRIADETPFVVEWFVRNGIRVWSTQEGEQRFDNHTDKLTNYIRFWQADGESEKTSIRTKTAMGQLVEEGGYKGGPAPYGYDLVKSGRLNKRKQEVHELAINEEEAAVVRIVFDKYVNEGYGGQRIATYLNSQGYRARTGKLWHMATINGMIQNLTYTGVLRCGEHRSPVQDHLQIISPEMFEQAQKIHKIRSDHYFAEQEEHVPMNTRGDNLLTGIVFCGHCGARLVITTSGKRYPCKADPNRVITRRRYICYGKTRKQTECDGQTGYSACQLEDIVEITLHRLFVRMKSVPKEQFIEKKYHQKLAERKELYEICRADYTKASEDLKSLKSEVLKSIKGESAFSKDLLSGMIAQAEPKCLELKDRMDAAAASYEEGQSILMDLERQYDQILNWADLYEDATIEAKKMIICALISRIEVKRDYQVKMDFKIDMNEFLNPTF